MKALPVEPEGTKKDIPPPMDDFFINIGDNAKELITFMRTPTKVP